MHHVVNSTRKKLTQKFAGELTSNTIFIPAQDVIHEVSDIIDNVDGKHGKLSNYSET
jgi:hypothetical protein